MCHNKHHHNFNELNDTPINKEVTDREIFLSLEQLKIDAL